MSNPFQESGTGKWSSSRLLGAFIVFNVLGLMWAATMADKWSMAETIGLSLLGMATALYGINKLSAGKPPEIT